jgi:ATP-dependent RNA helicase RhlE
MPFNKLKIHPRLVEQLTNQRITEPTPIQAQSIPPALEGRDVVAIAQTGTGKTLAFGLPALTNLAKNKNPGTRMLILTPTRELAHQIHSVLAPLGEPHGLKCACIYGGVGFEPQTQALRKGTPIIIATPGRLLDHIGRGNARFENISILVLDEADRMLDMGFMPDMKRIISKLPKNRQTMMFSATFPKEIADLAGNFQRDPVRIEVGAVSKPADAVTQLVYTVQADQKMDLLAKVLGGPGVDTALVFIRTKHRTDRVAKVLKRDGFKAQAIHGGRSQSQRQQAINGFRDGKFNVLVATDVAARGLDINGITHVVNFDIPKTTEDYVHRIGRTARAKATGDAITFVCPDEARALRDIERDLGKSIPQAEWEGAVALPAGRSHAPSSHKPRQHQSQDGPRQHAPRQHRKPGRGQGGGAGGGRGHGRPHAKQSGERSERGGHAQYGKPRHEGGQGEQRHGSDRAPQQHPRREHAPARATENGHGGHKHDDKLRAPSVSKNHTVRREPRAMGQFSRPKSKRSA